MRKYISLLLILSLTLGVRTAKTEAQTADTVDPKAARAVYQFLHPVPEQAIHFELAESIYQKTERVAEEQRQIEREQEQQKTVAAAEEQRKRDEAQVKVVNSSPPLKKAVKIDSRAKPSGSNRERIIQLASSYGLSPNPVLKIVEHESGFSNLAVNKGSGACGLFQRLPCSVSNNAEEQIRDGLQYIKSRYGTSENAWAWWQKNRWY